jgi:hypothetical protein
MAGRSFDRFTPTSSSPRTAAVHEVPGHDAPCAAGVRWLGVKDGNRIVEVSAGAAGPGRSTAVVSRPTTAGRESTTAGRKSTTVVCSTTVVFGSTHGARLLEIVGACAC